MSLLPVQYVLTGDPSVSMNSTQDELYFVYACIQQSFQNNLKECNMAGLHSSSR